MTQATKQAFVLSFLVLLISFSGFGQQLDWGKDTVSNEIAAAQKNSYRNIIRGSGQKATERVNLPVNKLKFVLDACAAHNITEISAYFTAIRPEDISRYRRNHPESTATDQQLLKSQLIVFRIPRSAFGGAMGAKIKLSNHPTMITLLSMGLTLLEIPYGDFDATGDVYLDLGTICPPPTSCD
jgi:hypothetical protein